MTDRNRRLALVAGLIALGALAGCGKQGALDRPAPMFGSAARAQYEAEREQEARDDAQRQAQAGGQPAPQETNQAPVRREVLDPNQRLDPASARPMPGAPNPFGAPVSAAPR